MSKTANSDPASWRQDIPSQPLTSTTSDDAVLEMTGKCTGTVAENPSHSVSLIVAVLTSAVISFCMSRAMAGHPDGLVNLGYSQQVVSLNGRQIQALIPTYVTKAVYKSLQENP